MGLATAACLADPLAGDGAAGRCRLTPRCRKVDALLLRRAVSRWCYSGSVWFEGMMALRTRLIFCLVLGFICRLYILQASQSHSESWQQFFLVEILNVCFNIQLLHWFSLFSLPFDVYYTWHNRAKKGGSSQERMGYITEMSQIYEEKKLTYLNFFKNELINKSKMDKKNSQTANLSLLRHKLTILKKLKTPQTLEEKEVKWSIKK